MNTNLHGSKLLMFCRAQRYFFRRRVQDGLELKVDLLKAQELLAAIMETQCEILGQLEDMITKLSADFNADICDSLIDLSSRVRDLQEKSSQGFRLPLP